MPIIYFITHPEVLINPEQDIQAWSLSEKGQQRTHNSLAQPWWHDIAALYSSTERKAIETTEIIAHQLSLKYTQIATLGEMDRSSTGYLPRAEFELTADHFFSQPTVSVRGWEKAVDAQTRIVTAIDDISKQHTHQKVTIISHGGVGALLLAHLHHASISRQFDQPGNGGGNYFVFDTHTQQVLTTWKPFDVVE
ncbi:MAG TPA: histidine phosphatase family protein [Vitreimonas sp.]|nr:histidine phosphatase family protein [Vitreimonas sp.]